MKASIRFPFQALSILFLAGSALLLFFIVLAGTKGHGVLNKWYFLAVDTSNYNNATYPISRWSMYGICGYEKGDSLSKPGNFIGCTSNKPAYPFDPKRNFGIDEANLWVEFQTNKFYYMTRFQFAFYLIALFFDVVALFVNLVSGCFRAAGIINIVSIFLTFLFSVIAASLSTAAYVQGRNVFKNYQTNAKIAPTLYGFAWAVVFMAILNLIFSCFILPKKDGATSYKPKKKGAPSGKRGGYRFGINKKKTTEGAADNKDASSFVRA